MSLKHFIDICLEDDVITAWLLKDKGKQQKTNMRESDIEDKYRKTIKKKYFQENCLV